jgi:hypothetical protein
LQLEEELESVRYDNRQLEARVEALEMGDEDESAD